MAGEGEKESCDDRTPVLGDEAGGSGDESAKEKADGVLVGLGDLEGAKINLDGHRVVCLRFMAVYRRKMAMRVKDATNQTPAAVLWWRGAWADDSA